MSHGLSRRTLLRGALAGGGLATVGLPLLEAMTNLTGTAHADGTPFPPRLAVWFWGNGTHPGAWAPATTGTGWQATGLLRGLAGLEPKVSVVSGTQLPVRGRNNPHVEGAVGILAGGNPLLDAAYQSQSNDWDYMTVPGPSLDEVAADLVGTPRYRSLVLGVTSLHGVNGPGTAVRYTSHRAPYLYNPPEFDPAALFARLFGEVPPDPLRASVLDAVLEDAASLEARLGTTDRTRLDAHLSAIRDLEQRIGAGSLGHVCQAPDAPPATDSFRARARQFAELSALALACDATRVVAMEFSSPASHEHYPDIFASRLLHNGAPTSFHEYEHNVGYDASVLTGLTYFVDVFGDFVRALDEVPEGGGTVLDHTVVLGTSEVSGGAAHTFGDFPLLVAGGAGGRLRSGRHVRLDGALASRVPLTCLRALDPTVGSWGRDQFATSSAVSELLA